MTANVVTQTFDIMVQLRTTLDDYGSKGLKARRTNPTAVSKVRAILCTNLGQKSLSNPVSGGQTSSGSESDDDGGKQNPPKEVNTESKSQSDKVAKAYGTHNGSTHVATFYKGTVTQDNLQGILIYLANMIGMFESLPSVDIRSKKREYLQFRDSFLKQAEEKYGEVTSDKVSAKILTTLSEKSFKYTRSQIEIVIKSNKPFVGATLGTDGFYYRRLKSKTVYSLGHNLISSEVRRALKECSHTEAKIIMTSALKTGGRIEIDPKTGLRIFRIDFGQLGDHVREMDTY